MQSAYLDDLQIHNSTHNPNGIYLAVGVPGIDFPDVRYSGTDRSGMSGHIARSTRYGGRRLPWRGFIQAEDVQIYNQMRRALLGKLSLLMDFSGKPVTKRLTFTTDDGLELFSDVVLSGKPELPDENVLQSEFLIPFFAPRPQLLSTTLQSATTTRPIGTGYLMPKLMPVLMGATSGGSIMAVNDGTMFTWPTLILRGVHTNPIMQNMATGQFIQLNLTTGPSDEIVITPEFESITFNGSQALINERTNDSTFWHLEAGPNPILFSTSDTNDTGTFTLEYRSAYVGS